MPVGLEAEFECAPDEVLVHGAQVFPADGEEVLQFLLVDAVTHRRRARWVRSVKP